MKTKTYSFSVIFPWLAILCWFLFPAMPWAEDSLPPSAPKEDIKILHLYLTGNNEGNLLPCDCPKDPIGGLIRTSSFLHQKRSLTQASNESSLFFHAGDFFSADSNPNAHLYILKLMKQMRWDGMMLGDHEFTEGSSFLEQHIARSSSALPIIATNVFVQGKPIGKPYAILETNGLRIGVFGLIDPEWFRFYEPEKLESVTFQDPKEAAQSVIPTLKGQVDVIICLSHLGYYNDLDFAKEISGIDIILGGHTQLLLEKPDWINGCRIVQADLEGKRMVELRVYFRDGALTNVSYHVHPLNYDYAPLPEDMELVKQFHRGQPLE